MTIQYIPVGKLSLSERYQARKTHGKQPLAALAASIHAQGLLQNLNVVKSKKRGNYDVVAGGRRLQAMQILVGDGRWASDHEVPVRVVDAAIALETSLAENVQREAMHPADEFEAFSALIANGESVDDVAARFGVSTTVVRQRMKLAAVAPEIIDAYKNGDTGLDKLMAFTITEDRDRQRAVWAQLSPWDRQNIHPQRLRALLKAESWTADHALARLVGLDAYKEAGGDVLHDLFADAGDLARIYLQHPEILQTLAREKLENEAKRLGEGWAWTDAVLSYEDAGWMNYSGKFGRVHADTRKLTEEETALVKELTDQIDIVADKLAALDEADEHDDDEWNALDEQSDALQARRAEIHEAAKQWPAELKQIAGVGVYVDHNGTLSVTYGLIRPEDRKAAQETIDSTSEGRAVRASLPAPVTRPQHSERLVRQLTAHKVGIVSADLAEKPAIALAVLVAQLAQEVLGPRWKRGFGLGVSLKQEYPEQHAPDFEGSKAEVRMQVLRKVWMNRLPTDESGALSDDVLNWALKQQQDALVELLAFLVAGSVQGIRHQEASEPTPIDVLARTAGTDIAAWWEPTAESYFAHVSKDTIVQAVTEGAGSDTAAPLAKLKKGEAADAAETALSGSGWLPAPIRIFETKTEKVDA